MVTNYANIAEAAYGDSLTAAKTLQTAVKAFIAKPGPETLAAVQTAAPSVELPRWAALLLRDARAFVQPAFVQPA